MKRQTDKGSGAKPPLSARQDNESAPNQSADSTAWSIVEQANSVIQLLNEMTSTDPGQKTVIICRSQSEARSIRERVNKKRPELNLTIRPIPNPTPDND